MIAQPREMDTHTEHSGGTSPAQPRMTAAEFRVITEWLGFRQRDMAAALDVSERTIRSWLVGAYPIPDAVRDAIKRIESSTAQAVRDLVTSLHETQPAAVYVHRTDEQLWAARPDLRAYPAGWWRMVVARAAAHVPGIAVEYSAEPRSRH